MYPSTIQELKAGLERLKSHFSLEARNHPSDYVKGQISGLTIALQDIDKLIINKD